MGQIIYRREVMGGQTHLSLSSDAEILSVEHGERPGTVNLLVKQSTVPVLPYVSRPVIVAGIATEIPDGCVFLGATQPAWDTGQTLTVWEIH